jgi:hypothetical protein
MARLAEPHRGVAVKGGREMVRGIQIPLGGMTWFAVSRVLKLHQASDGCQERTREMKLPGGGPI